MTQLNRTGSLLVAGFLAGMIGCQGDTGGGSAAEQNFPGTVFVSDDSTTGSISVVPNETEIEVGAVTGFFVQVRDASGKPVPNIQVACDSESGVAIIEPTNGFELTSSTGDMSGKIGCSAPGSYQFVCRLPVGTNLRKFVDIKCTGEIPQGFTGFDGASGGGLGGGVTPVDGTNTDGKVRITSVKYIDDGSGSTATTSIDVKGDTCSSGTAEGFFDTVAEFAVSNDSDEVLQAYKVSYSVDNADGNGTQFNSKDIGINAEIDAKSDATFQALIFDANSTGKRFADASFNIPAGLGFRSITFRIYLQNSRGDQIVIKARASASFDNFNRC